MDTLECIKTRRSVRKYSGGEIPADDLALILDCGMQAPSARNIRPWEFVVVTEKPLLENLANICDYGAFLKDAGAAILVVSEDTKYYLEDGSAATQNILLAAHALGYGSCWIAGDKKDYAGEVLALVDAPRSHRLVSIVSIGKTSEKGGRLELDTEGKTHHNSF